MAKKRIEIELTIDGKQAKVEIGDINGLTKKLTQNIKTSGTTLSNIGNIATGIKSAMDIGRSAFGAMNEVMGKYVEFDAGLKNVNTILNVSNDELKKYGDRLLTISTNVGKSGKDLTDAMYQAASAGVPAAEAIEFVGIAAKAATAGLSTTETAVDGITTVLNAFHMETNKASEVSDIMFQTVKLGKTTFDELSASLSQVAPLAASSGISFEEISAGLATLTKQGVPTSQAVTQIRASIISANEALGDGWSDTMTYQEGMQKIAESAGGSKTALKNTVGRVEAMNAVLALTGDNAKMASEDLDAMTKSVGAMNTAFETQTDSIEFKMNRLSSTIDAMSISFIDTFAGPMSALLGYIDEGIKGLGLLFGTTELDNAAGAMQRMAGFAESLVGSSKEYRDFELSNLSAQWDVIDKELKDLTSTASVGATVNGLLGYSTDAYEADINKIKSLKAQLVSLEEQSRVLSEFEEMGSSGGSSTVSTGITVAPARPSNSIDIDEGLSSMEVFNEKEYELFMQQQQRLRDAKDEYFLDEKTIRDMNLYEIEVAAMTEEQIKTELLNKEIEQQKLLNQIKDASTDKEFKRLQKVKDIVDSKIGLLKSESDASDKKDKEITKGANVYYNNQLSLVDNLKNMVTKRIKAYVAEAVVGYVSSIVASTGTLALFAAPAAYLGVTALMEGIIPSFDVGVRGYDGGYAKVHKDEILDLPSGTNVYTKKESQNLERILSGEQNINTIMRMESIGVNASSNDAMVVLMQKQNAMIDKQTAVIEEQTARLEAVERYVDVKQLTDTQNLYNAEQNEMTG